MAEEKWRRELVERAIDRDALINTVNVKVPPSAKYKKLRRSDPDQPILRVGKRLALVHIKKKRGSEVGGYGLGVVVDYVTDEGYWSDFSTVICQIIAGSNEDTKDWVGRLVAIKIRNNQRHWLSDGRWAFADWEWKNYPFDEVH